MTIANPSLPEPLQAFDSASAALGPVLADLDAAAARFREGRASGAILPNTIEALRIELTFHSNAIEGNTLSLRETQLVIDGIAPAGEKSLRDIYEARNHDRALRLVENWALQKPELALTIRDLLDVHQQVLADIDAASAGNLRRDRTGIAGTGFIPPGSQKFDALLPIIIARANAAHPHPLLQAAELHYNLVAVHPFNDGNGRTARLMMNHHLLRRGYPYAVVEVNQRGQYLAALDQANHGHIEPFARLICQCAMATAQKLLPD